MTKHQYNKYLSYAAKVSRVRDNHGLVHEAWLAAAELGKQDEPGYVAKCIHHLQYDANKKAAMRKRNEIGVVQTFYNQKEDAKRLMQARDIVKLYDRLPVAEQTVMDVMWEGPTTTQAAETLKMPRKTVEARVMNLREVYGMAYLNNVPVSDRFLKNLKGWR